jgi:fatty acid desaturase
MIKSKIISKIHNKYYDLSDFKHPGGTIPLQLADGRDATELFESHHLFSDRNKLLKILEKYEIPDCDCPVVIQNSTGVDSFDCYDWDLTLNSDFTKELKQIMRDSLQYKDIKAPWWEVCKIAGLFLAYLINMYYYYQGSYIALMVYPLSLWVFTVNIYHDASHFALSQLPWVNHLGTYTALMFSLTYCWYHQHIIGHHCFVNILTRDPDLYHSPLYVRHTLDIRKNKYHVYQHIAAWFIWLLAVPVGIIYTGFTKTIKGKAYNKVVQLSRALSSQTMYYEMAFVALYMFVLPYVYIGKILFVVYPYLAYSVLFMICTQINHLTEDTFHNHKNFFIHQILNSHNVSPQSYLMELFTGGLNLQIEHHLMPSVNHCHLRKLQPKIQMLCKKYDVQYNCSDSLWEALCKHYEHLRGLSR